MACRQRLIKNLRAFLLPVMVCVLLLNAVSIHSIFAILPNERRIINLEVPIFFGGENLAQQLCGTIPAHEYAILVPEIVDSQRLAAAIDEYISNRRPTSPFNGLGKYFVDGGIRAGINPVFVVALAVKESSLGTDQNTTALEAHNAFGRTANTATQPYIRPVTRAWYKWNSWEASLYSIHFPADGTIEQPDDMFQYIARRFTGNLQNGLEAFLEGRGGVAGYAPSSDGNDVTSYINTVTAVTNDLAELAGDSIDITRINPGNEACGEFGNVVATALLYSWPDYRPAPYINKKPEYETAIRAAMARGEYVGGLQYPGVDCGGFVTRVMRDSGLDPTYNSDNCNTVCQRRYLDNSERWQVVNVNSTADLEPGDIAMRTGHTFLYVGNQPGFETHVASASVSFNDTGWRAPMAGREAVIDNRLTWYRFTGADSEDADE